MPAHATAQGRRGIRAGEEHPGAAQLRLLRGQHAAKLWRVAARARERVVATLQVALQRHQRPHQRPLHLPALVDVDGGREADALQTSRHADLRREHVLALGVHGDGREHVQRWHARGQAGGVGPVEAARAMPLLDQAVEQRPEGLVAVFVARHRSERLDHRVASVVHARLDAPGQADAQRRPPPPQAVVEAGIRPQHGCGDAVVAREVRKLLRAAVRREAWVFIWSQSKRLAGINTLRHCGCATVPTYRRH
mmetsp:Transcript_113718/g.361346  ORF Transcript_113718/g.361346 Transcript_113718/m.361346 type:complete len:251 (+) Transcript_113718:1039-1791(+)